MSLTQVISKTETNFKRIYEAKKSDFNINSKIENRFLIEICVSKVDRSEKKFLYRITVLFFLKGRQLFSRVTKQKTKREFCDTNMSEIKNGGSRAFYRFSLTRCV